MLHPVPCLPCTKLPCPRQHHHIEALALSGEANALQFGLARPFAPSKQTPASGKWLWVGLPQAVLLNGKGFYGDCDLIGGLSNNDGVATHDTTCNVTSSVVAPGMSPAVSLACRLTCSHTVVSWSMTRIICLQLDCKQLAG